MNNFFLRGFVLALVLPGAVLAQSQDSNKPPEPPFLAEMPDNSTWEISVVNSMTTAKLPSGARAVNQVINTKSGLNRELVSVWTDGSRSQTWFWQGYRIEQKPGSSEVLVLKMPGGHDYQDTDFFGLGWLGASYYVGIEDQDGRNCYHFKAKIKMAEHVTIDYSAYIDIKTKRPVAWDVGPNHFKLVSVEARNPNDPLVLPESFATQLKAYRLASQRVDSYRKP